MKNVGVNNLSRRQRQIMDILYRLNRATVSDVRENMPHPPSYSAVRAMLSILENRGLIRHIEKGLRFVYFAVMPAKQARSRAIKHLISTFFQGSVEHVVSTLLDLHSSSLTDDQYERISTMVEKAKQKKVNR